MVSLLNRSGVTDFVLQRATAVVIAAYTLCVLGFFLSADMSHARLSGFFLSMPMQIFSTLALLSTVAHGWIGMWTIGTDYLRPAHVGGAADAIRSVYQLVCLLILIVYLLWGLQIIWQI